MKFTKSLKRKRNHFRLKRRLKLFDENCLRLVVFRSNRHIYAQLINDVEGRTLVAASSLDKSLNATDKSSVSKEVGTLLAQRAKAKNHSKCFFDRNGFLYHGRIQLVAEGAREAGLQF